MKKKDNHHYRFFVKSEEISGDFFISNDRELLNQVKNVFRLKVGDEMLVLDNRMNEYRLNISYLTNKLEGKIVNKKGHNKRDFSVNLFCPILKGDYFEFLLKKCTELGIDSFHPVIFKNSVIKEISKNKKVRFEKVLKESAEQSMRFDIPILFDEINFSETFKNITDSFNLAAILESPRLLIDLTKKEIKNKNINIFIGPEGDFSREEIELMEKNKFDFFNLGGNTLRSETACIVSIGIISQIML